MEKSPSPASLSTPTTHTVQGTAIEILARVRRTGIGMAVWARQLAPELAHWLDDLPATHLPDGRVLVTPGEARAALRDIFTASGTPDTAPRQWLEDDIVTLLDRFAALAVTPQIDVRLERIAGAACWKFHIDAVPLRMLTTYRGASTQWVERQHVAAALREQRDYRGPLQDLPRHSVALFKGGQAARDEGIVHRSPPMASQGGSSKATRLLLCLNLPSPTSPQPWRLAGVANGRAQPAP